MGKENLGEIVRMLYPAEFAAGLIEVRQESEKEGPYIAVWPDDLGKKPVPDTLIAAHEATFLARREAAQARKAKEAEAQALLIDDNVLQTLRDAKTRTREMS